MGKSKTIKAESVKAVQDALESKLIVVFLFTEIFSALLFILQSIQSKVPADTWMIIPFLGLMAFSISQLILVRRKKEGKYLRRLAMYDKIMMIIMLIFAALLFMLISIGIFSSSGSNQTRQASRQLLPSTLLLAAAIIRCWAIRRSLLQANDMLEGILPRKDVFRSSAILTFVIGILNFISNVIRIQKSGWVPAAVAFNSIVAYLCLGILLWNGSKTVQKLMK